MKRLLTIALAAGFCGGTALASNLNTRVESDGSSNINVAPDQVVTYEVIGELDDLLNEGLALAGFDLEFSGGPLEQADEPENESNMAQFKRPNGVTNPDGYGGTIIDGVLRQVGGGANTISNDIDNAPFPLGIVIQNIAHPGLPEVLVTGLLTIPADATPGQVFTLNLTNLFANVIREGETGEPPQNFWKTEAAGVGTNTDLTMTVACALGIDGSTPENCAVDARQPHDLNNALALEGWDAITLNFSCNTASVIADGYTITCTGGVCPTIASVAQGATEFDRVVTFSQVIPAGHWTCVENNASGERHCIGSLPGDVNLDGTTAPSDILAVIDCLNGVAIGFPCELANTDTDRSLEAGPPDILRVIDLLNGASEFAIWLDETLPLATCPSGP